MYNYQEQRENIFTEDGQKMFLKIRDNTFRLLEISGAVRLDKMIQGNTGDSWDMLACVDRMVELGDILEVTDSSRVAGQHRVFVKVT
jgi:hypothetical protein